MNPFQLKRILAATDFSEPSTIALRYGKELATRYDASLIVVYADPFLPPPYFTSFETQEIVNSLTRFKQAAREELDRYVQKHSGDAVKTEALIVESTPVSGILATAEGKDVDLIVMGTHGRTGVRRLMMGSVAEQVLRESHRPVLTVGQKKGQTGFAGIRHILCPVNFSSIAKMALEAAVKLSQQFDAELSIVYVMESRAETEAEFQRLCSWVPAELRARCNIKQRVLRGNAAEEVIALAHSQECDLIVLGAQHKRFFDTTVLGTTTVRVTRHAPCPVLTIVNKEKPSKMDS